MSKQAYENTGTNSDACCVSSSIHKDIVEKVQSRVLPEETVYDLADFFKCLGDSTRVKILNALAVHEMCVHDLSVLLCISQSGVSHQLRTLKNEGLVKFRREGKVIYYSLDDAHVETIFSQGLAHISHRHGAGRERSMGNG